MRASSWISFAVVLAPPVVAIACAGSPSPPPAPGATASAATTVLPVPTVDPTAASASAVAANVPSVWSSALTPEQRVAFMKERVAPKMRAVLGCVDDHFGCETCHGKDFALPTKRLARLVEVDGKITAFTENPVLARFMAERVVPTMASALGLPPYDPATKKGFGCHGCHEVETKTKPK